MPLISERFLWDWAQKLAKEQNEPYALVLVEMLKAIERNELPATFPHGPSSKQHDFKALIEELLTNHSAGWPVIPYKGNWNAISRISLTSSDVESWLAHRTSTKPKPAGTANLPTGMPGRPSKGKDIIAKEFARRAAAGETLCLLSHEAEALRNWYQNEYPYAEIPAKKTIKNNLRDAHRKRLSTQQQTKRPA